MYGEFLSESSINFFFLNRQNVWQPESMFLGAIEGRKVFLWRQLDIVEKTDFKSWFLDPLGLGRFRLSCAKNIKSCINEVKCDWKLKNTLSVLLYQSYSHSFLSKGLLPITIPLSGILVFFLFCLLFVVLLVCILKITYLRALIYFLAFLYCSVVSGLFCFFFKTDY